MAVDTPTALDVAREFIATKVALIDLVADLVGGQDYEIPELSQWAFESPVPHVFVEGRSVDRRADEIRVEMLEAVGKHLLGRAQLVRERVSA